MQQHELDQFLRHLFRYHLKHWKHLPLKRVPYLPLTKAVVEPAQEPKPPSKCKPPHIFKQETKWKVPAHGKAFCDYWKNHKISAKERKRLFDLLHKRALDLGFDEDLDQLSPDLLMRLFALVDSMWLGGLVAQVLAKRSIGTSFGTSPCSGASAGKIAGFCRLSFLGDLAASLRINMCKAVLCHPDLFKQASSPRTYQVGGVLCSTPLRCMLQVFAHEFVHALVGIFCAEKPHHGPRFRRILKAMFGQTTHVAGLSHPLTKTHTNLHKDEVAKRLKAKLRHGDRVTFRTSLKGKKKTGVFAGVTYKNKEAYARVGVSNPRQRRTLIYTVPLVYLTPVDS